MTYSNDEAGRDRHHSRAAIFVDYENIFRTLNERTEGGRRPDELVAEMIEALQRSLLEERESRTAVSRAYADFTSLNGIGDRIQRALYLQGVEPHFVPRSSLADGPEIQLCVDAMDLLHHRPDITTFVLLTGRRSYLPLVQMFRRYGRRVLVVGFEEPSTKDGSPHPESEWFFPAHDLLSSSTRQDFSFPASVDGAKHRSAEHFGDFRAIEDPMLLRTLEIIEQYFGQYEEVYLTPLLRKMSDLLDERNCDPKTLISDLEDHAAVRLEKRQGFPHDYTVLIVQEGHPDVTRVREEVERGDAYYYYDDEFDRTEELTAGRFEAKYESDGAASYEADTADALDAEEEDEPPGGGRDERLGGGSRDAHADA